MPEKSAASLVPCLAARPLASCCPHQSAGCGDAQRGCRTPFCSGTLGPHAGRRLGSILGQTALWVTQQVSNALQSRPRRAGPHMVGPGRAQLCSYGNRCAAAPRAWAHSMGTPTRRGEAFGHRAGLDHSQGPLSPRYTKRLRQDWPAGLALTVLDQACSAPPAPAPPTPVGKREACVPGHGDREPVQPLGYFCATPSSYQISHC